eukprot:CAMPEP_0204592814 /NCGR_PEP_ID=MMETSP0661-20131031/51148_1 /ASSEMBLY_ACC=CAM_ASM_000606 /TAXON_ID=109239 /ORGANISM="Alexandrium margalefi, Strain AMGDE01CS-322" /LENGTH=908 /DNA_ID=CAMNT_0051603059 /DNA_START=57 /DNA_END=2783 /DNA_ORIENTATION=+
MIRCLLLASLPAALLGQATCSDHLMLQVQLRQESVIASAAASKPQFDPEGEGKNQVCRGAGPSDRGTAGIDYFVWTGAASLSECKRHCMDTSDCQGIEYSAGRCEVWTRPQGVTKAKGYGYTCLRLSRTSSPFVPADGGVDRACRGRDSRDRGLVGVDYILIAAASLAECKITCATTTSCHGIEFKNGRCEVWTRAGGIGATARASGFQCYHYRRGASASTTTTSPSTALHHFEPMDGGNDRACRGSSPRDRGRPGKDYMIVPKVDALDTCKYHCVEMGQLGCRGIEYSAGRCEIWTREGGIQASAKANGFYCARYGQAQGTKSCGDFDSPRYGTDLVGTLIAAVPGDSPTDCCHACGTANGCEGFAYVSRVKECYLKTNVTGIVAKAGVVAQVKNIPTSNVPTCDNYGAPQVDRDVAGVELQQARVLSSEYCCAACERAVGCQGFAYLPDLEMCYLKANVTGTYAHPGRISQLKPMQTTPPPTARPGSCDGYGTLLRDTDLGGVPLAHVHVRTVDECCGACDQAAGCEGYAYLEEFSTCYLKAYVTGTYPKQGPVTRLKRGSGLPDQSAQPSCRGYQDDLNDTDVVGRLLGEVPATSPSQCCGACEEIAECEGFTFYAKTQACYLKADVSGTYPHAGRHARTRRLKNATRVTPPLQSCEGYAQFEPDLDLVGTLLKEVPVTSADTCCLLCAEVQGCDGFSYLSEHSMCYLKGDVTGTYNKTGCISRTRLHALTPSLTPAPQPDPEPQPKRTTCNSLGDLLEGEDIAGALIAEESADTADHCCGLCNSMLLCEGFSYLEEFRTCYLKAFVTGTYEKSGCVSRMRPKARPPQDDLSCEAYGDLLNNTDLSGDLIEAVYGENPLDCCGVCSKTIDCKGFAFMEEYRQCYLKAGVTGTFSKTGVVTRMRSG